MNSSAFTKIFNSTYLSTSPHSSFNTSISKSVDVGTFTNCQSIYDGIEHVSSDKRIAIVFFYCFISALNVVANGLAIYVNITCGQWKQQSMFVVLLISVSDILNGIVGSTAQVVHILIPDKLDCSQRRVLVLLPHTFSYFSTYCVLFLGLDRFLHVILMSRYKDVIKRARLNAIMAIYLVVGIGQAIITTYGPKFFGKAGGARYSAPVNNIFIGGTVICYLVSIVKLKLYAKSSRTVSSSTLNISKLASVFLIIITVTYSPIILSTVFSSRIQATLGIANTNILAHSLLLLSKTNSSLNAVAYMRLNSKARRRVNAMFRGAVSLTRAVESTV